jgi:hypothetical protein
MRAVQMRYSQYRHALEAGSGHVWQGRYYSCPVEPACLAAVMRYVELNPLRARMVEEAREYPWSSARAHLGEPDASGTLAPTDWMRYLLAARRVGARAGGARRRQRRDSPRDLHGTTPWRSCLCAGLGTILEAALGSGASRQAEEAGGNRCRKVRNVRLSPDFNAINFLTPFVGR